MVRVCVIGCGTAGAEAAAEVLEAGGDAVVIEKSAEPRIPWTRWPDLISPSRGYGESRPGTKPTPAPSFTYGDARSAGPEGVVTADGAKVRADRTIIATGSKFEPGAIQGGSKPGAHVLGGPGAYEELGRALGSISDVAVQGEGGRGFEVAERLAAAGRRVTLFASSWQGEEPSSGALGALACAAEAEGIQVAPGTIERAVGLGRIEGVVAEGEVVPCDSLVMVPRRLPGTIPVTASTGPRGGILVDSAMRSTLPGVYAAGGCAELGRGLPPSVLSNEARPSGRIAGANAMGQNLGIGIARTCELSVFGLRWLRAGVGPVSSRCLGVEVKQVSMSIGPRSACTIFYGERSGKVLGIETVEDAVSRPTEVNSVVAGSACLRSLAYGGGGSSDISLVSDTARLGLRSWSRS